MIVRGIDTIRKFLITEDYGILLDPKNNKCIYGFFVHDFYDLKAQSAMSLDTALIDEKSASESIKQENSAQINNLAPKKFYQNLLLQYNTNAKIKANTGNADSSQIVRLKDITATMNSNNGFKNRAKEPEKFFEVHALTSKLSNKETIEQKFSRSRRKRASVLNTSSNRKDNSRQFYSHDHKDRHVTRIVDFEAAKIKRRRMNSISGYTFHPSRHVEKDPLSDRLTPYKKMTTNLLKKLHELKDPSPKPKPARSNNTRILNGEQLIENANKEGYFIPFYKKTSIQDRYQKVVETLEKERPHSRSNSTTKKLNSTFFPAQNLDFSSKNYSHSLTVQKQQKQLSSVKTELKQNSKDPEIERKNTSKQPSSSVGFKNRLVAHQNQ